MRIKPVVRIAVMGLALTSLRADDAVEKGQGHLQPCSSPLGVDLEYYRRIDALLLQIKTRGSLRARGVVFPSFRPEASLSLYEEKHAEADSRFVLYHTVVGENVYRGLQRTRNDPSQAPSTGDKDASIGTTYEVPISKDMANDIIAVWLVALQGTSYAQDDELFLDGTRYEFSVSVPGRLTLFGQATSTDSEPIKGLTRLLETLMSFTTLSAQDPKRDRSLAEIRQMLQRLKKALLQESARQVQLPRHHQ